MIDKRSPFPYILQSGL